MPHPSRHCVRTTCHSTGIDHTTCLIVFVDDLDSDLAPTFWREVLLSCDFIEDRPDFSFVVSLQFLSCSALTPLLSFAFPFLRLVDGVLDTIFVNFGTGLCWPEAFSSSSVRESVPFFFVTFLTFVQNFVEIRKDICDSRRKNTLKKTHLKKTGKKTHSQETSFEEKPLKESSFFKQSPLFKENLSFNRKTFFVKKKRLKRNSH